MTIEHCENWSIYGGNVGFLTNGVYAQAAGFMTTDPDPTSSGFVYCPGFNFRNSGGQQIRYVLGTGNVTTLGMAQRWWLPILPTSNNGFPFMEWDDAGNNTLIRVGVTTTGSFQVYSAATDTTVFSDIPNITANAWWHIEVKVVVNGAASTVQIRVEGAPILFSGSDTITTTISQPVAQTSWGNKNNFTQAYNQTWLIKDLVIWNGNGSRNHDWLGSVVVYSQKANGDVAAPWALTGAATATDVLNTTPPQDSTIYASAAYPSIPAQMEVDLTTLPTNVTTVRGMMTFVRAKKIDGGDGNLQNGLISNGVQGNGADRPITAAATYWRDVFETDPNTSDTWTVNAANAAHLTINRTV